MTASRQSRESLQPARNTRNDSANISGSNTGKQGSRVAQATLNHLNGTGSSATTGTTGSKSHLLNMPLAVDEEDTLGVKQLEELMRASQKSGLLKMLQSQPRESREQQYNSFTIDTTQGAGTRTSLDKVTIPHLN